MAELDDLLAQAKGFLARRDDANALPLMKQAFELSAVNQQKAGIAGWIGGYFARQADLSEAISWFQKATELAPEEPSLWFESAELHARSGDQEKALQDYLTCLHRGSRNARHYLAAGAALTEAGREEEAAQTWSLGDSLDPMLRKAQFHPHADEETKERSRIADKALRKKFSELHRQTIEAMEGDDLTRIHEAVWVQTHDGPVNFNDEQQQPQFFFLPSLPSTPYFPRETLAWSAELEAVAPEILAEYEAAVAAGATGQPYVHAASGMGPAWETLKGQDAWHSIHLYKDGEAQGDAEEQFPRTLAAVDKTPIVKANGKPLEVFFSVLKPGTHIPPHFGLANSRLTVHLPLIVPSNCAIRVGNQIHSWTEGEVFAFDDSFEHEAWNKSDETRVVLIFEAWTPGLTDAEQNAISASFESRIAWLTARRVPEA